MTETNKPTRRPRVDLRVRVRADHQSRLQEFYSRNLSSGGIYLEVEDEPPPVGSTMKLTFEVPGLGRSITAEAVILHHHSYEELDEDMKNVTRHGMGLRFLNLETADEEIIQKYVSGKDLSVSA